MIGTRFRRDPVRVATRRLNRRRPSTFFQDHSNYIRHVSSMFLSYLSPASFISADLTALEIIIGACNKLATGEASIDDIWPGEKHDASEFVILSPFASLYVRSSNAIDRFLSDCALLNETQKKLRGLKGALKTLKTLQTAVHVKISYLEHTVTETSYHFGLQNLPDNILLSILKLCSPGWQERGTRSHPNFSTDSITFERERRSARI